MPKSLHDVQRVSHLLLASHRGILEKNTTAWEVMKVQHLH